MSLWGCLGGRRMLWKILERVHCTQVNVDVNRSKHKQESRKSVLAGHRRLQVVTRMRNVTSPPFQVSRVVGAYGGMAVSYVLSRVVSHDMTGFVDDAEGVGFATVPLIVAGSSAHLTVLEVVALCFTMTVVVAPLALIRSGGRSFKLWVLEVIDCLGEGFGGDVGVFGSGIIRDAGFDSPVGIGSRQLFDAEEFVLQCPMHFAMG
jgi:hypothetical protein